MVYYTTTKLTLSRQLFLQTRAAIGKYLAWVELVKCQIYFVTFVAALQETAQNSREEYEGARSVSGRAKICVIIT